MMCRCEHGACGGERCDCRCHLPPSEKELLRAENLRLRKALDHATRCPLMLKAKVIMGDEPEKLTACDGCRDTLVLMKELSILEGVR
jgi:hypothetical protein